MTKRTPAAAAKALIKRNDTVIFRDGRVLKATREHNDIAQVRCIVRNGIELFPVLGAKGWTLASVPESEAL
jgi:hypothetical protein